MKWIRILIILCIKLRSFRNINIVMIFIKRIFRNRMLLMRDLAWSIRKNKIYWKSQLLDRLIMEIRRKPRRMKGRSIVNLLKLIHRHWFFCRKSRILGRGKLLTMSGGLLWSCQGYQNQVEFCKQFRFNWFRQLNLPQKDTNHLMNSRWKILIRVLNNGNQNKILPKLKKNLEKFIMKLL